MQTIDICPNEISPEEILDQLARAYAALQLSQSILATPVREDSLRRPESRGLLLRRL